MRILLELAFFSGVAGETFVAFVVAFETIELSPLKRGDAVVLASMRS